MANKQYKTIRIEKWLYDKIKKEKGYIPFTAYIAKKVIED